jgi:metal-sulfur cluster biosynthetic enzyme
MTGGLTGRIEAVLDQITDPCSVGIGHPAGIVTMGLIKSLETVDNPDGRVDVALVLRLTSPCCMMGPHFAAAAESKLKDLPEIGSVIVTLSPEIDWEPAHMRRQYRDSLPRPAFLKSLA